jgi:hypothetical protein
VEDLKKSVDDLKKLVPCTIEEFAKVIYLISLSCCIRSVFRCFPQKTHIFDCASEKLTCFITDKMVLCHFCVSLKRRGHQKFRQYS